MKKSVLKYSLLFLLLMAAFGHQSCKKSCQAGSGGGLTVAVELQHHGHHIPNLPQYRDTVYIKYNTQNSPGGLSAYDAIFIGREGEDHVHVSGLRCGDYYFFGVGGDTTVTPGDTVHFSGGIPFSTESGSGEVSLVIPVAQ